MFPEFLLSWEESEKYNHVCKYFIFPKTSKITRFRNLEKENILKLQRTPDAADSVLALWSISSFFAWGNLIKTNINIYTHIVRSSDFMFDILTYYIKWTKLVLLFYFIFFFDNFILIVSMAIRQNIMAEGTGIFFCCCIWNLYILLVD